MNIYFINPPFKAEYGKFSRESRSPAITKSGALYYPLWLIYAALYSSKQGHNVSFLDAPAKQLNEEQSLNIIRKTDNEHSLFVLDTSTPSIKNDVAFAGKLKAIYPHSFVVLVGTHPSACAEETLGYSNAVDAVAIGEYDCIVNELANVLDAGKDLREVRGLCFWDGKEFVRTAHMPPMKNLDDLPFASQFIKEHLNERDYFFAAATYPSIQIFTGRGCPFRCNFCVYPQTMHGHAFRARSAAISSCGKKASPTRRSAASVTTSTPITSSTSWTMAWTRKCGSAATTSRQVSGSCSALPAPSSTSPA